VALAQIHRLSYAYPGGARALREAEAELGPGLTLVTGPSGGGKSTLLRVLNGLVPHFHGGRWQGTARVAGLDVLATPTARLAREVGFVFQDPERQSVAGRVEQDVAFALENVGTPPREAARRVAEAMEVAGISHLRERRLPTLSGGERQRVAIAGALALQPAVLVLDEPTSQLDAEGADAVLACCADLASRGLAVVISEHRVEHLLHLATAGLRVEAGGVARGAPALAPPLRRQSRAQPGAIAWEVSGLIAGLGRRPLLEVPGLAGRRGELLVLEGPNGGGKTTLLRTLAGLAAPLSGRVERAPGRIAYLPQDPAALLHRPTVAAEVAATLRLAGAEASAGAVAALLSDFGLAELGDRHPRDLSGGQRERAAMAAVLAVRPEIALLDEPTRGMDADSLQRLVDVVDRLLGAGTSVVIATHDRRLAEVADRVARVAGGGLTMVRG
jgi:energy-coupling factor transport system ATP-binding protein